MTRRRYQLRPWLIRALIPVGVVGTYILWSPTAPVYIGRSDTCLRRRLTEHAANWPEIFFTYDVAISIEDAYAMECSLFHALADHTTNIDHPTRAGSGDLGCPFCMTTVDSVRTGRLSVPAISA